MTVFYDFTSVSLLRKSLKKTSIEHCGKIPNHMNRVFFALAKKHFWLSREHSLGIDDYHSPSYQVPSL